MSRVILTYRKHKEYKNPFRGREKKSLPKRIKLNILLLFACISLWLYFLFFSPVFALEKINIQIDENFKEKKLIEEQINNYFDSAYFFSARKKNYFLFNKNNLQEKLNKYFFIKEVKIEKSFPNQLTVQVEKIKPAFILNLPYESLYLNSDGIILEKYPSPTAKMEKYGDIPNILINQDVALNINDKIFSEIFLNFINRFYNLLKEYKSDIKIEIFEAKNINQTQGSIKAKLYNNGYLYLNASLTPEQQLENFLAIYKDKIQPQNKQFEYIDLRFGDKVYIK